MTSRSDLDTPATVIAAIVGVAIILIALPFTIAAFPQTPKAYDVAWGETALDAKTLTVTNDSTKVTATVTARNFQPASIRFETTVCNDNPNPSLQQQAAVLHVKLTRSGASAPLKEMDVRCPGEGFTVSLGDHADVASAQALNESTARRIVWLDAMAANVTGPVTYTLEVQPSRAASTIPPLPGITAPSLTASLRLTLNGWDAAVNEHQKEVGK